MARKIQPGEIAFGNMTGALRASQEAQPPPPPLPQRGLSVPPPRPNFTMPRGGPEPWTPPPALTARPAGTALATSTRPNFTIEGEGPSSLRNNAGATDAVMRGTAPPNMGPDLPGGMRPNAGPTGNNPWPFAGPTPKGQFTPPEKPTTGWFRGTLRRAGEAATAARSTVGAVGRTVSSAGAPIAAAAVPGMVGSGVAAGVNSLRQSALEAEPAFVAPEAKPGDIPSDPTQRGPAPVAGSFLNQSELGRNVGNAVMAMPGVGSGVKAVQGALRALPLFGRSAQAAEIGARAVVPTMAAAQGFAGGDANNPGTASPAALAAAAPAGPPVTPGPTDTRHFAPPPAPANAITRSGNSYSGTNNVAGDDIRNPDGSLRNSGSALSTTGFGVSTVGDGDGGANRRAIEARTSAIEGRNSELRNDVRLLEGGWGGGGAAGGIGGGRIGDTLRAKTDAGRVPAGLSARQAAGFQQQEADRVQRGELATAQLGVAAAGQNQGLRIAEMNNATQRDNNAATTRVALRGHELDYQGRMAPIEVARQQRLRAAAYMGGGGATADGTKPAGGAERYAAAAQAAAANGDDALAQHFSSLATSEQARGSAVDTQAKERAATTERLFKPHYTKEVVGANGVVTQQFDEIGAAKAAARLRGQFGEQWDRLPEAEKAKHIGAAAAKERNAAAERQVTPGFVDRALDTVGLYRPPPAIESGERPLAGGQLDTGGPLTSRASRKDTVVRLRDGSVINYGEANSDQLADIQQRLRAGK